MTQVEERGDGSEVELYELLDAAEVVEQPDEPEPQPRRKTVYADITSWREYERRSVVPAILRSPEDRRALVKHVGGRTAHSVAFHGLRTVIGWYPLLASWYASKGVHRTLHEFSGWAFDREYKAVRAEAIRTLNMVEARAQYRQRKDRVKWRLFVYWGVLGLAAAAAGTAYALLSRAELIALAVALFIVFLRVGKPKDKPVFQPAVVRSQYRKLTADMVEKALVFAGLAKLDKEGKHTMRWVQPVQRDGAGYLAVIDLPPGVTFEQAMAARASIASGLHVATARLWLEADKTSERTLRLWVADRAMADLEMPLWPLLKAGRVDVFAEFPFGLNARGRVATMSLMYSNLLVGAIPGQGKSFAARLAALACSLDPTCELHIFDLKGGGDWLCFEQIAHAIGIGDQPEDVEFLIQDLREVQREMQRRYALLQQMARAKDPRAPEAKTTRELANDPVMRMHPVLFCIDEVQHLFTKGCEFRDEADQLLTDLVKRGRAVGVIGILATQKPDAESLPSGIRDNVGTRFALRVMTPQASDMVLGGGMSKAGYRAHAFTADDLGVGFLRGRRAESSSADAEVVKGFYVDLTGAERVATRARLLREGAGTITGHAAGVEPMRRTSLLEDVLTVMDGDRQHCGPLATALALAFPDQYAGWDAVKLGSSLRAQGVPVKQMKISKVNLMGVERRLVLKAAESRFSL